MKLKLVDLPEQICLLDTNNNMHAIIKHIAQHDGEMESYYICDIGDIVAKHGKWQQHLPHIKPYYSLKCNNSTVMMELMAAVGSRFGCASKDEIREVLDLGVSPEHIIFANPIKLESHIRYAATVGVNLLVVTNEMELYKIKKLHPEAKLLIHITESATAMHTSYEKTGYAPENNGLLLIDTAHSLGLEIVGVTFHVDCGCSELEHKVFHHAVACAKNLFIYGAELGYKFNILNIGGGFSENTAFTELTKTVNLALEEYFPNRSSLTIEAETGYLYTTSAFTLVTHIHLKKETVSKDLGQDTTNIIYYINNSKYHSFSTLGYKTNSSVPIPRFLTQKGCTGKMAVSSIFGPTCDSADTIMKNVLLPVTDIGDYIIFENMGAYTLTSACTFNGFAVNKVHIFVDENLWVKLKDVLPLIKRNYRFTSIPGKLNIGLHNAVNADHAIKIMTAVLQTGCQRLNHSLDWQHLVET